MKKRKKKETLILKVITLILVITVGLFYKEINNFLIKIFPNESYALEDIPEYDSKAYIIINNNEPNFGKDDLEREPFEYYSDLDILGRARTAFAKIGVE